MSAITAHPVAEIFPAMSDEDHKGLVEDVREHGLREPIWLHRDGRIIDGRNRYRACGIVGIEPRFRTYEGDDADLLSFVVSLNLRRRHLTESQRATVAARIATMRQGERTDLAQIQARSGASALIDPPQSPAAVHVSQADAAKMLNVSRASVQSARKVLDRGVPELVEQVERGEIAVSTAAAIADEPAEVQREVASLPTKRERQKKISEIDARRSASKALDAQIERAADAGLIPGAAKRAYDAAAERAEHERLRGEFEAALAKADKAIFGNFTAPEVGSFADKSLVQSLRLFASKTALFLQQVEERVDPPKPDPSQPPRLRAV